MHASKERSVVIYARVPGSMALSNNSGLIKFLDDNRDSYEERVFLACHQNASYVNRIALFPPARGHAIDRRRIARLQHKRIRDILFL